MKMTPKVPSALKEHIGVQKLNFSNNTALLPLLPQPKKSNTIWDSFLPGTSPFAKIFDFLHNIVATKLALVQLNYSITTDNDSGADYERYLQIPNPTVQALALSIVNHSDSDDTKMYKIEQWVIDNIDYVSDIEQYKELELWAYPTMTLKTRQGDCEDGAFLLQSLALHANVDSDRLRTYGGLVITEGGTNIGGHAWTAYRRESDDEWINLDWCYWATNAPLDERKPMTEDLKYIDDYFFVQATKTVETPYSNRIRFAINPMASITQPMSISITA